ncbi:MAG: hypothetical protein SGPRY_002300 [Prymnesium sp.]
MLRAARLIVSELSKGSAGRDVSGLLHASTDLVDQLRVVDLESLEKVGWLGFQEHLLEPLKQQFLLSQPPTFIQACTALQLVVSRLGESSSALIPGLLPLLVDQCSCSSRAGVIGYHAHLTICTILRHILAALALRCTAPARAMLGEQLLLCLLLPGGEGGVKRRAQLIALSISRLIHDPSVRTLLAQGAGRRRDVGELLQCVKLLGTGWIEKLDGMAGCGVRSEKSSGLEPFLEFLARTRALARHSFLILMERCPRATAEPLRRFPHRTQRALQQLAKMRSSAVGPPCLPPPLPPPPAAQAVLIQAAARGRATRATLRRHACFVSSLSHGSRVSVGGVGGRVVFQGPTSFAPGGWVGVELDWPVGRHDGAHKGQRYFQCAPRMGVIVRPLCISPESTHPKEAYASIVRRLEERKGGKGGRERVTGRDVMQRTTGAETAERRAEVGGSGRSEEACSTGSPRGQGCEQTPRAHRAGGPIRSTSPSPPPPSSACSTPVAPPQLKTLLQSHKGVLHNIGQASALCCV